MPALNACFNNRSTILPFKPSIFWQNHVSLNISKGYITSTAAHFRRPLEASAPPTSSRTFQIPSVSAYGPCRVLMLPHSHLPLPPLCLRKHTGAPLQPHALKVSACGPPLTTPLPLPLPLVADHSRLSTLSLLLRSTLPVRAAGHSPASAHPGHITPSGSSILPGIAQLVSPQ